MDRKRVVVTGLGVISSVGIGKDDFWKGIINGKSGISKITSFDTEEFKCKYGGEVKEFNPGDFIAKRRIKFLGKTSQLAISASLLALEDAKLPYQKIVKERLGVVIGTTIGEKPMEELATAWARGGLKDVDRRKIAQASVSNISTNVGINFKSKGLTCLIPTACAAGNYAIGYGFDLIKRGDLTFVLAGGAEAFSRLAFVGFQRLYAMAPDTCRPFDKNRKGLILGEGSGVLLLESLDSALKRKANIYAEVLGYGLSCDAYHPTAPDMKGIAKAIEKAVKDSGIPKEEIGYVCAHGTGTPANDKTESSAIKYVFGSNRGILVSSIKSMLGHTMGASSAIAGIASCLAIRDNIVPPTINYETPDPECDIDCVPNKARRVKLKYVLNNGFAFGGNNCCVVFGDINKG